jgi:hypothetical protein
MTSEKELITQTNYCIRLRDGGEIWIDSERAKKLQLILENIQGSKFINIDDETINTADLVGIFEVNKGYKKYWR